MFFFNRHFVFKKDHTELFFYTKAYLEGSNFKKIVILCASLQTIGPSCFVRALLSAKIKKEKRWQIFDFI